MYIAGVDEAGTGAAAGPFTVGVAVFDTEDPVFDGLRDSKELSEKKRDILRPLVEEHAVDYVVGWVDIETMGRLNIHHAKYEAMKKAIYELNVKPDLVIVDGTFKIPDLGIFQIALKKADQIHWQVSAASILAKTHRDERMVELDEEFPQFNWKQNKGYMPTRSTDHYQAILKGGMTEYHRYENFKFVREAQGLYENGD